MILSKIRQLLSPDNTSNHLLAKILINQQKEHGLYSSIQEAEFKVYSQFGDDGIIQYLIQHAKLTENEKQFIELGVENYKEANTRFLLVNNNWKGFVVEGNPMYVADIKRQSIYWQHDLTAVTAFITKKNITNLIKQNNFHQNIGLLSIDLDGNDYWIWKELTWLRPVILIIEYNSIFANKAVTIPYKSDFIRTKAHFSNLYWGTSLKSLCDYSIQQGYAFVGTNSAGNNAYFIRHDRLDGITPTTLRKGFTQSKYRESRDRSGQLTYLSHNLGIKLIQNLPVYNTKTNAITKIKNLFNS